MMGSDIGNKDEKPMHIANIFNSKIRTIYSFIF